MVIGFTKRLLSLCVGVPALIFVLSSAPPAVASVLGDTGGVPGRVYHDLNNNGWNDAGEGLVAATVVLTDEDTGVTVARMVTDADGMFTLTGLPEGEYDLRVDGPWKGSSTINGLTWFQFMVHPQLPWVQEFRVFPGTERENRLPNLKAFATFDKPAYSSGDLVKVRLGVTNIGDGVAERAAGGMCSPQTNLDCDQNQLGDLLWFSPDSPGVRIGPGETREVEITATIRDAYAGVASFDVWFNQIDDANFLNNTYRMSVPMKATRGSFSGVVYGDRNGNRTLDPGERLDHIRVSIAGGVPQSIFSDRTDAQGRFSFPDIPTGRYSVGYDLPAGWVAPPTVVTVDEQDDGDVLFGLERPLFQVLDVSMAFTKSSYAEGETAHLAITMTNNGSAELTGIVAMCMGAGNPNEFHSFGPNWGDLAMDKQGVTLRPGQTRSFDVLDTVQAGSLLYGFVRADCHFGFGPSPDTERSPFRYAEARVPGSTGTASGFVICDRNGDGFTNGEGLPNTKVVLFDRVTGEVLARTTTDADGHFVFVDLPAYLYELRVIGPWKPAGADDHRFEVHGGETLTDQYVFVLPGVEQPDPDAPPLDNSQPQGDTSAPATTLALAATGVDVIDLIIAAFGAFGCGLALMLVRRRAT